MKVLITGGAGYIGSHTNRYFSRMGAETVVLDDLSAGHREAVIAGRLVRGDFGDAGLVDRLMAEEHFDAIVHFGAFADVADSVADPAKYYENNVDRMLTLLKGARDHGIRYFVFSSSAAIFGEPVYTPIDENHPKNPINPYGRTKLIGEYLLQDFERAYGMRYCALRYFNAAGAAKDGALGESHTPEHHLIPLIQRSAMEPDFTLSVYGTDYPTRDGSCLRDYVHVEDLAAAHWLGLRYIMDNDESQCFNMGSGRGVTVLELLEAMERLLGHEIPSQMAGRRPGDPAVLLADNRKVCSLLGWEPVNSGLDDILKDAWRWEQWRKY